MKTQKQKGNAGELKTAKILMETFSGEKFSRSPNSGAFASTHKNALSQEADAMLAGDLICPQNFRFCVEVKSGYRLDLGDLLDSGNSKTKSIMRKFLKQVCTDADRVRLAPMLVYIRDRREPVAIVPAVYAECVHKGKLLFNTKDKSGTTGLGYTDFQLWAAVPFKRLLDIGGRDMFFDDETAILRGEKED
jgi:hypothetical protein